MRFFVLALAMAVAGGTTSAANGDIEWIELLSAAHINTLGLSFDIIGVCLLFKFGLPENISREGYNYMAWDNNNYKEKQKAKFYDRMSFVALFFIVIGFVFQIISNYLEP